MEYAGLDVHKEFVQACWVNSDNEVAREGRFPTTQAGLRDLCLAARGTRCVLEASTACYPVYDSLQEASINVIAAHPFRVKAIASAKVKTDKIDARTLAQLNCANLIPQAHLPSRETRNLRDLIKQHITLTQEATGIKNQVHAMLLKQGIKSPASLFTKKNMQWASSKAQGSTKIAVEQDFQRIELIKTQRKAVDEQITALAMQNPDAVLLKTLPGFGWFTALLVAAQVDGVKRFTDSEHLQSYSGLVPATRQSANVKHSGRISKQGSSTLRWALVQAAWRAVREKNRFRKKFLKLSRKIGSKKAIVAVARKMISCAYFMLLRGESYKNA